MKKKKTNKKQRRDAADDIISLLDEKDYMELVELLLREGLPRLDQNINVNSS